MFRPSASCPERGALIICDQGGPALLGAHLVRLKADTSFKEASGAAAVGRLVDATLNSLTTAPSALAALVSRVRGGGPFPLHYYRGRCGPWPVLRRKPWCPFIGSRRCRLGLGGGSGDLATLFALHSGNKAYEPSPTDPPSSFTPGPTLEVQWRFGGE